MQAIKKNTHTHTICINYFMWRLAQVTRTTNLLLLL